MTTTITYHRGDVLDVVRSLPAGSVRSAITSPPYWRKRSYIDPSRPEKAQEWGQEDSPGAFIANLLTLTDALWDVVADDGTIWVNLGDSAAQSGGAGGDYSEGGLRSGQNRYEGTSRARRDERSHRGGEFDWSRANAATKRNGPQADGLRAKSVCWIPELFGASLAYGRNLLTGGDCRQWITRPPVVWCKPAPTPGQIIDKFREATELIVWAAKQPRYYFDLDAVREPPKEDRGNRVINSGAFRGHPNERAGPGRPDRACNPKGVPPLTWWVINTSSGVDTDDGAHFATYPLQLLERPVAASTAVGDAILDPFGGSGTTGIAAALAGRDAVLIDLDDTNVRIAGQRFRDELRVVDIASDGDTTTWTVEAPLPNQRAQAEGQRSIFDELEAADVAS